MTALCDAHQVSRPTDRLGARAADRGQRRLSLILSLALCLIGLVIVVSGPATPAEAVGSYA